MESIGLAGIENAGRRLTVLRALDKLDRLGRGGVEGALLGEGRKDESGDFTKGAGLGDADIGRLLDFLQPKFPFDILVLRDGRRIHEQDPEADTISESDIVRKESSNLSTVNSLRKLFDEPTYQSGLDELEQIAKLAASSDYPQTVICIDPSVVRGLEYYTGPVYEVELTFEIKDDKGRRCASARSAAADAMTASCRVSAASRCRRPASPSASRACRRRSPRSASSAKNARPARWWSPCSTATAIADYQKVVASDAQCRHPRRTLSRQSEEQSWHPAQICRQARLALAIIQGGDEEAAWRSADQGPDPRRWSWPASRIAPNISKSRPRRSLRSRKTNWSRKSRKLLVRHKLG